MLALLVSHPCETWGKHYHASLRLRSFGSARPCADSVRPLSCIHCTFMNALWALRPCKAFGRSFYKASVPYPHRASSPPQHQKSRDMPVCDSGSVAGRGCRIVLALLVSHRAKLGASTITHPCVCGRLGRRVLAPTLCDRYRASLHVYERSVGFASCKAFGRSFYKASVPYPHCASSPPSTKKQGYACL